MYADIIVDITHEQLDRTFQYRVPEGIIDVIRIGDIVTVPFGSANRQITGYVIDLSDKPKFDINKTKDILGIVPDKVRAVGKMIELAAWLKHQYGSTMNQALKTVLPVKDKIKTREKKYLKLVADKATVETYLEQFIKKNATARFRLLTALKQEQLIDCEVIRNKLNISNTVIQAMVELGIAKINSETYYRNPVNCRADKEPEIILNEQQKNIVDSIIYDYNNNIRKTYLLHGITGSGKTICYIELIEHIINMNLQAIVLIPEIALTFQTVQRFYHRFKDKVSIMNSRMSKGERYDQFLRAMRGEISVMIGPRSALFTPFPNLGLIVIDEEHEMAYKSELSPKYHARETAIHIAKTNHASVILGSATPSMEAYYRALKGEYKLFVLSDRALKSTLPKVYTEDMREELKCGNRSVLSRRLQLLIQDRLSKHQQIMLFLNKRGYAGFISCRSCGHVMKCPHCDISLTAHNNGKLVCHYCGYEEPQVHNCPKCGSKYILGFRAGTQKIEEVINKIYPNAKTLRMDMDTTSGKEGHQRILSAFANHEADILIGTQMIVKGHDFSNVTLVGILAADMSLYAGDFRASERTFQLLTQAAGRAGRGEIPGEVVIQTYTPDNYSIIAAATQDYNAFYNQEIEYRKAMEYPPVTHIMTISFSSEDEQLLKSSTEEFMNEKVALLGGIEGLTVKMNGRMVTSDRITWIGPTDAPIYKKNDIYTRLMVVKAEEYDILTELKAKIDAYTSNMNLFNKILIQYDFD